MGAPVPAKSKSRQALFAANGSFIVPAGIEMVWISACGGGQGGAGGFAGLTGGGGGGGGASLALIDFPVPVIPGLAINFNVGAAGLGGGIGAAGAAGGATTFSGAALLIAVPELRSHNVLLPQPGLAGAGGKGGAGGFGAPDLSLVAEGGDGATSGPAVDAVRGKSTIIRSQYVSTGGGGGGGGGGTAGPGGICAFGGMDNHLFGVCFSVVDGGGGGGSSGLGRGGPGGEAGGFIGGTPTAFDYGSGGGGGGANAAGGNGGSGVVIIRWLG